MIASRKPSIGDYNLSFFLSHNREATYITSRPRHSTCLGATAPACLVAASRHGKARIVQLLLEHYGVNPNVPAENHCYALEEACQANHIEVVQLLLSHGAQLRSGAPLVMASWRDSAPMVQALLEASSAADDTLTNGNDDNSNNNNMTTSTIHTAALGLACLRNSLASAQLLLQHGRADTEVRTTTNAHGMTPLLVCAEENYVPFLHLLLKYGANPNATDNKGETALCKAVSRYIAGESENLHAIQYLLEYGAAVEETTWVAAIEHDCLELAKMLLLMGRDITSTATTTVSSSSTTTTTTARNELLQSAVPVAVAFHRPRILKWLLSSSPTSQPPLSCCAKDVVHSLELIHVSGLSDKDNTTSGHHSQYTSPS